MDKDKLKIILDNHKLWLETKYTHNMQGTRADLSGADLGGADLSGADLGGANLGGANLRHADLSGADLSGADLGGANLGGADLSGADLGGADIDFSCLPLWCGSLKADMDDRQVIQLLYHVMSVTKNSNNVSRKLKDNILSEMNLAVANEFHRVEECGPLER